ncbi:type II secretory pathway component PulK [Pelomonas saccharophila]|uniref:Type II secretory pathway component PulK n=1 Tax=Roseateles saccharophilus TaxID=304 RepID=A0ABU1YSP2_ROSSA|nr:type II secretion system protein GspK [Roseateles saccharophilus]MDR7271867.1 type II secretory pathway component PulK [Roseateles saccharophilus]
MKRRAHQSGYVLLMVLGVLAVMAFVVQRFAQRNDDLRRNALDFQQYADGQAAVSGALAATLYWNATRPLQPTGRGDAALQLREDGRPYKVDNGAWVQLQDVRGLLSANGAPRAVLQALLVQDGVTVTRAQAMIDVLDDYIDTDNLKRLNGAERGEYQALGLPGPRNDWLLSLRELQVMPLWRDDPARLARWSSWLSSDPGHLFNPATAPPATLRATFPTAPAAQIDQILQLRAQDQLRDLRVASAVLGLPMAEEDYILSVGNDARITLWSPGLPMALEYNARLTPAGELGPWVITEQHSTKRLNPLDEAPRALAFPLATNAQRAASSVAP